MSKELFWSLAIWPIGYAIYWWFVKTRWQTRHAALWSIVTAIILFGAVGLLYGLVVNGQIDVLPVESGPRY